MKVIKSQQEDVVKLVDDGLEASIIHNGSGKSCICAPTQTSCRMGCKFCYLSQSKAPAKNLHSTRIIELIQAGLPYVKCDTLLVAFMGAGEPLLNIENVIAAAKVIQHWPLKSVRFSLATMVPSLKALSEFNERAPIDFKLHYSLHHPADNVRHELMPCAEPAQYVLPLLRLLDRPVEIHYTPIDGLNDSEPHALRLALICGGLHIKLMRFNPGVDANWRPSKRVGAFAQELAFYGASVEIYAPPGADIGASCGQFERGT